MMKRLLRLLLAALFCVTLAALSMKTAYAEVIEKRVEPGCTEPGQILKEDTETHVVTAEVIPALGHSFGDWISCDNGLEERICSACGERETRVLMTEGEARVPQLRLTGSMDGMNKKVRATLGADFTGKGEKFNCYAIMTMQGHSTLGLDKCNYTVRFYNDPNGTDKHKLCFGDWHKEHKYILKADYYDVTQCRNLTGAQLWREMVKIRDHVDPRISSLPTLGAVDGFPVSVWLNDGFLGLYTLCLHKDDDLFEMRDGEQAAILICNRNSEDEAVFRAPAELDEDGVHDWEIEYCGTEDWTWAKDSFNRLIDFTMHSTDEEFREGIGTYLDVDAAIDYLNFIYTLGLVNSGVKDLVLVSFGGKWIPSVYDMDEAFGLMPEGKGAYAADVFLPRCEEGVWTSETGSLLWDRLLQNFEEDIRTRYRQLRSGPLSEKNILAAIDGFASEIPNSLYLRDAARYPGRPDAGEMTDQMIHYITERLPVLDEMLGGE